VGDDALVDAHAPVHGSPGRIRPRAAAQAEAADFFERYAFPEWLRRHSEVVGAAALELGLALHSGGADVDVGRVALAGYLHDLGRSPLFAGDGREHNELSALALVAEGLPGLAELARRHPVWSVLDADLAPRTLEERVVFYADRRGGQSIVSIEERIAEQIQRYPEHADSARRALPYIREIERELFAALPFGPDGLAERVG
jgi:HD superfamily phosphodiesterase